MDQRSSFQSVISSINGAKRELETMSKSGLSKKSTDELDLAYNSLNDCINHCNTAMKSL